MATKGKRVLVIGAGCSGLTAIKCCLDEGLDAVCYERTDRLGGLWHYTDRADDGQACVMKSTTINTSKEMMSFSDFPVTGTNPNFMHHSKVLEYFQSYVDRFELMKCIQFNKEIVRVEPAVDFSESGQWVCVVKDKVTGTTDTQVFGGVLLCTGHHADKRMPNFPGEENFEGRILHSHDYKCAAGFEDKRVVVIGMGNSSGDAAVELSRVTSQLYMSTRRGSWVVKRVGDHGLPADLLISSRFTHILGKLFGQKKLNEMIEKEANKHFDHQLYKLKPDHHFTAQHPMVNDDLPNRISTGSIIIKPDVKKILKCGVEFQDGSIVQDIDAIIYATGYVFGFPFLDKKVIDVQDNEVNLYKYMFPPNTFPSTLAVIGCIQPIGATIPMAELQSRWATRVIKGVCKLPTSEEMWKDIKKKKELMSNRYIKSPRHTIQVDWIPYMDELAEQIGCKPNIGQLLVRDPRLAFHVYFGPCSPVQYRLMGPGQWDKARETLLQLWDRVYKPFNSRPLKAESKTPLVVMVTVAAAILLKLTVF